MYLEIWVLDLSLAVLTCNVSNAIKKLIAINMHRVNPAGNQNDRNFKNSRNRILQAARKLHQGNTRPTLLPLSNEQV